MQCCVVCKQFINDKEEKDSVVTLAEIPLTLCENCKRNFSNLQISKIITERRQGIEWAENIVASNIFPESMNKEFLNLCEEAKYFIKYTAPKYNGVDSENASEEDKDEEIEDKALESIEYSATVDHYNQTKTVENRRMSLRKLIISTVIIVGLVLSGMGYAFARYLEKEPTPVLPQLTVNNACTTVFGTDAALEECRQVFNNYYECFLMQDFSTASDYILFFGDKAKLNKVDWKYSMKKQFVNNVDYTKPVSFTVENGFENDTYKFYKFTVTTCYTSLVDGTRIKTSTFVYGFVYDGCWYLAPNSKLLNDYMNNNFIELK